MSPGNHKHLNLLILNNFLFFISYFRLDIDKQGGLKMNELRRDFFP
ncbi:hypothetical protein BN1221_01766c [Brenneria goodwinii]|uniref:Uncharacterized protein n=1 Tax=Brenneria goodwinii TaxID=1109412 RepID=A0A0G4JTX3_9GAMM|nr:hypothetical protein BN1221_01766c [Brenneria goodwinii]